MSKNPFSGNQSAQEVSVGVAIEPITRLRDTLVSIKGYVIDIVPAFEGTSKSPSRFTLIVHDTRLQRSSYFIMSSDGAIIASADTSLYATLFYDPMNGYMPSEIGTQVSSPSVLTVSELFEKVDEHSEAFLNDQIDLIAHSAQENVPFDRTRLYLYARALDIDNPTIVINGIYAFIDTIPLLFDSYPDDLTPSFIHLHGGVLLIVQAARTINQAYVQNALIAIEELESQLESLKEDFWSSASKIGDAKYIAEVKEWIGRYEGCLGYAFARIKDHRMLRDTGAEEPQKLVSSMSNPWRSSYVGTGELAWEARMLDPARPKLIENTTLSSATEILQIDQMIDAMRRKGLQVANPIEAVKHIIGFEPCNVVTEIHLKNLIVKTSQSFFGLCVNGQALIREYGNDGVLSAVIAGKQTKFHAAYPPMVNDTGLRIMIFHPKALEEESVTVTFDSSVLAKDPESGNITAQRKIVPPFELQKK